MTNNIDKLKKELNILTKKRKEVKRSMDYFKSSPKEQELYNKFKYEYIDLDIRIVRFINELNQAEQEYEQQVNDYASANETKIEKLIRYINKESESISGNDIKREAVLEALEVITNALQQLNDED